jgi:hypothetical protein
MSDHLYLVLSKPPDSVSDDEYQRWYHDHVRENIEVPVFSAARRYRVGASPSRPVGPGGVAYSHLAVYEYDGDIEAMQRGLKARIDSGDVVLPPWFDQIDFQAWDCAAAEDRVEAPR